VAAGLADALAVTQGPVDPAVFLARMMDLRGSVDLAQGLEATGASGGELAPASRADLRAIVVERTAALREGVLRTLADPFQRRSRLPTPEQVVTTLLEHGVLVDGGGRPVAAAADAIWSPCGALLARVLDGVRFELAALREELGPRLAALGLAVARLERLDAALVGATAKGRAALEERLLSALGPSFASRFASAVAGSPRPVTPALVGCWFEAGGLLRAEIDRGRDAVLAILDHDRRRLLALVTDR